MSSDQNCSPSPLAEERQDVQVAHDIAIRVQSLSKCYQIYDTPRDRLKQFFAPRLQRLAGREPRQYFREFWALKDISLEIRKGETVGIIGRNGSGKSTLLQIFCGTLSPTSGSVETNGRVAALLELGSGFNPEFSGRENVYLNAAVLGLSRGEVDQRFNEIAAFADIGDFIEQPVKTYSSGMYLRLAFAVIAHVNADILVIDEALAVGDAVFTQKCMRFIRKFRETGTLVFVSHDMSSILNLCQHAVWLHGGQLREIGGSKAISESYLQYTLQEIYGEDALLHGGRNASLKTNTQAEAPPANSSNAQVYDYASRYHVSANLDEANGWKTGAGEIKSVQLESLTGGSADVFKGGETVRLRVRAVIFQNMDNPILGFLVRDRLGQDLFGENTLPFTDINPCPMKAGQEIEGVFTFRLPMLPNGQYAVMTSLADGDLYNNVQHHWLHDALVINVSSSKVRWGLTGVPFDCIALQAVNDE